MKRKNKIYVAKFTRSENAIDILKDRLRKENMLEGWKKADYILVCGDRIEMYDFALKMYRMDKKIIHLWAGDIDTDWTTYDEVYRHSMTLMSCVQLCTTQSAKEIVEQICKVVKKKPNAYVVGNLMLCDLNKHEYTQGEFDLILYNPVKCKEQVKKDIKQIKKVMAKKAIWLEPNNDNHRELIPYNCENIERKTFLGLLQICKRFISNSSCVYYEAKHLMKLPQQIIHIGKRNKRRNCYDKEMSKPADLDKIVKILKELK